MEPVTDTVNEAKNLYLDRPWDLVENLWLFW